METVISQLLNQFEEGKVTRRQLIQGLAAVAVAAAGGGAEAAAQAPQDAGLRTLNFDHASYDVTDYRRTRDFYAGLLGMTVVNDDGQ